MHGAREVGIGGQFLGRSEQHRGVTIVPAGMHLALDARGVRQARGLLDKQGVHVGPQADAAAPLPLAPQRADDTRLAEAAMDLDAEVRQEGGNQVARAGLLEGGLGMAVDVTAQRREPLAEGGVGCDRHSGHGVHRVVSSGMSVQPSTSTNTQGSSLAWVSSMRSAVEAV